MGRLLAVLVVMTLLVLMAVPAYAQCGVTDTGTAMSLTPITVALEIVSNPGGAFGKSIVTS